MTRSTTRAELVMGWPGRRCMNLPGFSAACRRRATRIFCAVSSPGSLNGREPERQGNRGHDEQSEGPRPPDRRRREAQAPEERAPSPDDLWLDRLYGPV